MKVMFDVDAASHPKLLDAGMEAGWIWFASILWACRYQTDGKLPKGAPLMRLMRLWGGVGPRKQRQLAAALVHAGLWLEHADRFEIHEFSSHQGYWLRTETAARRQKERTKKAGQRAGHKRVKPDTSQSVSPGDTRGTPAGQTVMSLGDVLGGHPGDLLTTLSLNSDQRSLSSSADQDPEQITARVRASDPERWAAQHIFRKLEQLDGPQGMPLQTDLAAVVRFVRQQAGTFEHPAFDLAVERLLGRFASDTTRDRRWGLKHLARNPGRYWYDAPAQARPMSPDAYRGRALPASDRADFTAMVKNNPDWVELPQPSAAIAGPPSNSNGSANGKGHHGSPK